MHCLLYYECDAYGHVNHANYLRYMQETAFDASAAAGYDLTRYEEINRAWLVWETDISYLRPQLYDDWVTVKTWVLNFRRVRSRPAHELRHTISGEIVARATTDWVFVNDRTGRPETVPQEMIDAFLPDGPPADVPRQLTMYCGREGAGSILRRRPRTTW